MVPEQVLQLEMNMNYQVPYVALHCAGVHHSNYIYYKQAVHCWPECFAL
jgi:hypothetical protein